MQEVNQPIRYSIMVRLVVQRRIRSNSQLTALRADGLKLAFGCLLSKRTWVVLAVLLGATLSTRSIVSGKKCIFVSKYHERTHMLIHLVV